jgi:hypothetical protein
LRGGKYRGRRVHGKEKKRDGKSVRREIEAEGEKEKRSRSNDIVEIEMIL